MCTTTSERWYYKPLAFWSKALSPQQCRWSAFDKELLHASLIETFHYFLDATEFSLKTDHKSLVNRFYGHSSASSPRQQRYLDHIAQLTNKVEYVSDEENVADIVSRPKETPSICAIFPGLISLSTGIDYALVASEQARDLNIANLFYTNQTSLQLKNILLAEQGTALLCDGSQNRVRVVVPNKLRFTIFKMYHSLSHPGIDATAKLIQRAFVWYNMKRDIPSWVRECQACAKSKVQTP